MVFINSGSERKFGEHGRACKDVGLGLPYLKKEQAPGGCTEVQPPGVWGSLTSFPKT
uniref:Uncharacterized protein n=1 Tax=Hyaloperonospora arabidopsidis (strain Emoy2) TaxID=559515 RepID=M4BA28_HYAAE